MGDESTSKLYEINVLENETYLSPNLHKSKLQTIDDYSHNSDLKSNQYLVKLFCFESHRILKLTD